jgi:hypothetical protein
MNASTDMLKQIVEKNFGGWEAALADAEQQMFDAERRAARLKATASVIRKMIANGEPWPGKQSADQ